MANLILINTLRLSEEELEAIERMSSLNYTKRQMAMYLDKSYKEFLSAVEVLNSEVAYRISKGKLEADFKIQDKLLENAKSGNITAIQMFDKFRFDNEIENIKARILYGEEN
jgi:hypothetical protein